MKEDSTIARFMETRTFAVANVAGVVFGFFTAVFILGTELIWMLMSVGT